MIELTDISKSYGQLTVLSDATLTINRGEVVSVAGPSGAGKTTLLQIIGTLLSPDSGRVVIDGIDVTKLDSDRLSHFRNTHIGFVFQFHQLLPEFTIQENVALPAMIAGESQKEAMRRAAEILDSMSLSQRLTHRPSQLSGGEKQRAAVARAIINNPDIILADEPSGSLDSHNRRQLYDLFFDIRQRSGTTFVIVTHDESLAAYSDRIIRMCDGRIIP